MDWWMVVKAFAVGGALCVVGQLLIDLTKLTPARILVMYVTAGVALTAIGLYDPLIRFAGGGASIPLTGFGYAIAKGVEEAIAKDGWLGILTGGLGATAAGITFAIVSALLCALLSKPKEK